MMYQTPERPLDVLIVDDNPHIRRLLVATLGKDFKTMDCEDSITAMEMIFLHKPKVVLLDIMMPSEVDGLQLLDALRGNPSVGRVSIAMLTARGQQSDKAIAMARGADAYFVKPFSPTLVHEWVRERLHLSASQ